MSRCISRQLGATHALLCGRFDSIMLRDSSHIFNMIGDWTGDVDSPEEYENRLISIRQGNIDDLA